MDAYLVTFYAGNMFQNTSTGLKFNTLYHLIL
jgi:hypothetical protein